MRKLGWTAILLQAACFSEPDLSALEDPNAGWGEPGNAWNESSTGWDDSGETMPADTNDPSAGDAGSTGDDGWDPPTTGGDGGGDTADCECEQAIDAAWSGPYLVRDGSASAPPSCAAGEEQIMIGGEDLDAPPAQCSCECGVGSASCSGPASVQLQFGWSCFQPGTEQQAGLGECVSAEIPSIFGSVITTDMPEETFQFPIVDGSCELLEDTVDVPIASFQSLRAVCAPETTASLCTEDGQCTQTADAQACIVRSGEHACTDPRFPHRSVIATHIDDTRECSACDCGTPTGYCEQRVSLFTDDYCSADQFMTTLEDPGSICLEGTRSARYDWVAFGQCEQQGGEPIGAAVPADVHTVCCAG